MMGIQDPKSMIKDYVTIKKYKEYCQVYSLEESDSQIDENDK